MAENGNYEDLREKEVFFPLAGGMVDKIEPLLEYAKPFPHPGTFTEVFLIMKNITQERIEGWLTLDSPEGWQLEPGKKLMIAVRPGGTILAEFFLSAPPQPEAGPHLLQINVTVQEKLVAQAAFDLRQGLLFLVED